MKNILKTSHEADARLLRRLRRVERICLLAAGLIAAIVLSGWLLPPLDALLPEGWSLMKPNSALATLLAVTGFALEYRSRNRQRTIARRICASLVVLLAGSALLEHATGEYSTLNSLLSSEDDAPLAGLMSKQTAFGFLVIGLALLFDRDQARLPGYFLDFLNSLAFVLLLLLVAGYVYKVTQLVGHSTAVLVSPQTLWCFILLTFALISRRAAHGIFAPLVSIGIGGQIARILIPSSIAITYLLILLGLSVVTQGHLSLSLTAALAAASIVIILFFATLLVARRVNGLESRLRASSLTDELTGLHNFRGLTLMGEQMLREARRGRRFISLIFIDVDGLKAINDSLGHETGSKLLIDMASLLRDNFRDVDLVGRLGGDEFAVIVKGNANDLEIMLGRFETAVEETNQRGENPYRISCSLGMVTTGPNDDMTLIDMLAHADAKMYENKRAKRAGNGSNPDRETLEDDVPLSGC